MEVTPGFEPGIKVLQTYALPLGYVTLKKLAGVEGFDPRMTESESVALPLGDTPMKFCGVGSGIRTHEYRSHNPGS